MAGRVHGYAWRDKELKRGSGRVSRPMVQIEASHRDEKVSTKALIDTGSPRTIFPRGIGDSLFLEMPDLKAEADDMITLMGRDWSVARHEVLLHLPPFDEDEMAWSATVDVVMDEGLDFVILGYEGFLNHWGVSINGYNGYVLEDFNERQPPEVLRELGLTDA